MYSYIFSHGKTTFVRLIVNLCSVQNVPCGTSPVTCSKSVVLTVGQEEEGVQVERITLARGQELLPHTRLQVRRREGVGRIIGPEGGSSSLTPSHPAADIVPKMIFPIFTAECLFKF